MKTCVGCKHYAKVVFLDATDGYDPDDFPNMTETYRNNVCEAFDVRNPVSGLKRVLSAADQRTAGGQCGPDAKLWASP